MLRLCLLTSACSGRFRRSNKCLLSLALFAAAVVQWSVISELFSGKLGALVAEGDPERLEAMISASKVAEKAHATNKIPFDNNVESRTPNNGDEDVDDTSTTTSPVASMLSNFPNRAVEREIRRHDRYLVDSLVYLSSLDERHAAHYAANGTSEMRASRSSVIVGMLGRPTTGLDKVTESKTSAKPYTVVILTMNRILPYLAVLISMLLRGHRPGEFVPNLDVHVCNIERRLERKEYHLFHDLTQRLSPLISFHNWTDPYEQNAPITDANKLFLANRRLDYIRALELCKERASHWCIVLEDDAVPPVGFAKKLEQYLARESYLVSGAARTEEVARDKVGIVKLFSPYNDGHTKTNRGLLQTECTKKQYDADIAEGSGDDYVYLFSGTHYRAVAEAILSATLDPLIAFLRNKDSKEIIPTDELINYHFIKESSLELIEICPSLVNHMGFVSEHNGESDITRRISTDVRFKLVSEEIDGNPVAKMLGNFSNTAVQREVEKHDRYMISSLVYLNRFGKIQAERYANHVSGPPSGQSVENRLTVIVLTINRILPYISVWISVLLRGHTPKEFMRDLDVHVINIERRPGRSRYYLFDDLKRKLPFISFHSWTHIYEQHSNITDAKQWYLANQRLDYIRALRICRKTDTKWCVVMEDDAVPCVGFIQKFRQYVDRDQYKVFGYRPVYIDPRAGGNVVIGLEARPKIVKQTDKDAENVPLHTVGVVKLYYPWNDGPTNRGLSRWYAKKQYHKDRALNTFEANTVGRRIEEVKHKMFFSDNPFGAVADAYHRTMIGSIIEHLEATINTRSSKPYPMDTEINSRWIKKQGLERIVLSPSLVNHIGYISEHAGDAGLNIPRMSTDVRFQLDDETYWRMGAPPNTTSPTRGSATTLDVVK